MNRSASKRSAMLDAGLAELAERGLAGASMEAVAARAEVSKRTLYKHFPSKEALFEAVVAWMAECVEPLARLRYERGRDFAEQLREVAAQELQLICDPQFIRLSRVLMIEAMRSQAQARQLLARFAEKEASLYRWFAEAGAAGQLGELAPATAADAFAALLKTPAYWLAVIAWQAPPGKAARRRIADEACRMLLCRLKQPAA